MGCIIVIINYSCQTFCLRDFEVSKIHFNLVTIVWFSHSPFPFVCGKCADVKCFLILRFRRNFVNVDEVKTEFLSLNIFWSTCILRILLKNCWGVWRLKGFFRKLLIKRLKAISNDVWNSGRSCFHSLRKYFLYYDSIGDKHILYFSALYLHSHQICQTLKICDHLPHRD